MARMARVPCAIEVERAPIVNGVAGDTVRLGPDADAHANLSAARMIYARTRSSTGMAPAVIVELGDVVWRYIVMSDVLATHWARELTKIAQTR